MGVFFFSLWILAAVSTTLLYDSMYEWVYFFESVDELVETKTLRMISTMYVMIDHQDLPVLDKIK